MRKVIAGSLFSGAGLVGSTVVTMMWPTIDPKLGWHLLEGCAAAVVVGIALLAPDGITWVRERRSRKHPLAPPAPGLTTLWRAVQHIAIYIGEPKDTTYFPTARAALRQAAIEGKVKIWGRKQINNPERFWIFSDVITEVPREYWENWKIAPAAAVEQVYRGIPYTQPEQPEGQKEKKLYADLQVSEPEIESVWPTMEIVPERVPIRDFLIAAEVDGWQFKGSKNVLYYFGKALKQAAADGAVEIQGRISKRSLSLISTGITNVLARIPAEFFHEHEISHAGLHGAWMPGGVNHQTKVCDILEKGPTQYIDLHVMKPQAWNWLHGIAARKARDMAMTEERARQAALAAHNEDCEKIESGQKF